MHMPANSPGEWLTRYLCGHLSAEARAKAAPTSRLIDGGWLREQYERMMRDGTPGALAATWLAGWYAGGIATSCGYTFVGANAALCPDLAATRWVLDEGGWVNGIVFHGNTPAAVVASHPWAGRPDTRVVSSRDELRRLLVDAIVEAVEPVVEHLATLSRAGRTGLWHQVGDALPAALTWTGSLPLSADVVAEFAAVLALPAPWRRRPTLEYVEQSWGSACVAQRGGCCLAYLDPSDADGEPDEDHRLYEAAFAATDLPKRYCASCRFRPYDDSRARQLWWRRREALRATN